MAREAFSSRVTSTARTCRSCRYLDRPVQPFGELLNLLRGGEKLCDVEFFIDDELKSRKVGMPMGSVFDIAFVVLRSFRAVRCCIYRGKWKSVKIEQGLWFYFSASA